MALVEAMAFSVNVMGEGEKIPLLTPLVPLLVATHRFPDALLEMRSAR